MKILFIKEIHSLGTPGLASTEYFPAELAKLGHTVSYIGRAGGNATFLKDAGVRVYEIPATQPWLNSLVPIVRQEAPDIVHTFPHMGCGLYPFRLRQGNRPKFVLDIRSPLLRSGITRWAVQMKNRLEVIGYDAIVGHGIESAWTVVGKRKDITLVPPGIQLSLVPHRAHRASATPPYRLIYVGTLDPKRRLDQLVMAVTKAARSLPVHLDVFGPPLQSGLETLQRLDSEGLVTYRQLVPRAELFQRIVECDLAVSYVPRRLYDAGPPLKTLEYLACGMPTLATDTIGNRMFVRHDDNGWLVDEDPDAVSAGILQLLNDPALRQRLADGARSSVEEYDWGRIVTGRLMPVYQSLIGSTADAPAIRLADVGK